jgi:uncharacterized membrane protein YadS
VRAVAGRLWPLAPGAALAVVIAAVATALGDEVPVVGAPVIAIVCGIIVTLVKAPTARLRPGIAFTSRKVLQASVIVLGFGLSLRQVVSTGVQSLPVLLGTLLAAFAVAWLAGCSACGATRGRSSAWARPSAARRPSPPRTRSSTPTKPT